MNYYGLSKDSKQPTCGVEETFLQDFIEIQNFFKILKKCFLDTTCRLFRIKGYQYI